MLAFDELGDPASSDGPSTCVGIAHTAAAADQTAERECRSRGISHVWNSCMRITSDPDLLPDGESALQSPNVNRISLPFPKLRPVQFKGANTGRHGSWVLLLDLNARE